MSKFDQRVEEVVDSRIEDLRDLFLADDPEVVLQALRRTQDDLQDHHSKVMNLLQGLKDEVQKLEHRQEQQEEDEKKKEVEQQKEEVTNRVKDTIKRLLDSVYNVATDALIPDSVTPFLNQIGSILGLPEIPTNVVELGADILDPVIERLQDPIGTAAKLADVLFKMQMKSTLDAVGDSLMGTNARIQRLEAAARQAAQDVKNSVQDCCKSMGDKLQGLQGQEDHITRGMVSEVKNMVQSLMANVNPISASSNDELGNVEVEELIPDYP